MVSDIARYDGRPLRYVSPAQRHEGQQKDILIARDESYQRARQRNPARWAGALTQHSNVIFPSTGISLV